MHSRRSILGRIVGAMASAPVATAILSPPPAKARQLEGPITPDQYIEAMHQMGWQVYTGCWIRNGVEMHAGVIERIDNWYAWNRSEGDQSLNIRLRAAIGRSGVDFYDRVADRLYDLGQIEHVGPKRKVPS